MKKLGKGPTMNSRVKRSDAGYGLRRVLTKRRWDEDFEYYFSKISSEDSPEIAPENSVNTTMMTAHTKRPVGRPRKHPLSATKYSEDMKEKNITNFPSEPIKRVKDLKPIGDGKKIRSPVIFTLATLNVKEQDVGEQSCIISNEEVDEDVGTEADILTGLHEEEVSSVPEGEKENLSDESVTLGSDSEDVITHMTVDAEDGTENVEVETSLAAPKIKRQHRRNCISDDMLRKLSELGSDDKIECNVCHKLLKPSSFRQHVRTHYGVKPFGCFLCDAKFTRKGDVDRHIRIVHYKDKPYKCCKCQRGFGDRRNLRWHLKNHDKKLFYVCEVCGFKFGKRVYWENHVRYIHPLPKNCSKIENVEEDENCNTNSVTETLLVESEGSVDDPNEEISALETAVESIPNNESLLAGTENLESNALKLNSPCGIKSVFVRTKDCKLWKYDTPEEGVETVIIHLKPPNEENVLNIPHSNTSPKAVVYQIDSPQEILEILQKDYGEHNLPTSSNTVYEEVDDDTERLVEVAVGEEGVRSVEYVNDFYNANKVCKITLSEDQFPSHQNPINKLVGAMHQTDHKSIHYKLTKIQAS